MHNLANWFNVFGFTNTVKPRLGNFYTFGPKLARPGYPDLCYKWSLGFCMMPLYNHMYKRNNYAQFSPWVTYLVSLTL